MSKEILLKMGEGEDKVRRKNKFVFLIFLRKSNLEELPEPGEVVMNVRK